MTANDNAEATHCLACGLAFRPGDRWLPDVGGGVIHFDCCAMLAARPEIER